jgi:hypothetical protein
MLDFDAALAAGSRSPLPEADGSIGEIRAPTAFITLIDGWAEWLLELRRVLSADGRLVIGLAPTERFEALTGGRWDDARVGMTVLSALDGPGRRQVFHSEWWLRAHWGRAFEIVSVKEGDRGRQIVLTKRSAEVSVNDLERPDPGDLRELEAAQANAVLLSDQVDRVGRELEQQREDISRELMRRSFAAADAQWASGGPGSPATAVAAQYEATTSWRLTKPLRALGGLLRRDR